MESVHLHPSRPFPRQRQRQVCVSLLMSRDQIARRDVFNTQSEREKGFHTFLT